jgi:type I restriction enzyme M protein
VDGFADKVGFIWSIAELLRGDYKRYEYGKVVLPLVVLRRLDCALADTKEEVLRTNADVTPKLQNREAPLRAAAGQWFFNTSRLDLPRLLDDADHLQANLLAYVRDFSVDAQDVLERFDFPAQVSRLAQAGLLYKVVARFAELDLHPDRVSNVDMGYIFEELIRRFSEQSNETAGEHFTPREVISLMVNLLFCEDTDDLTTPGRIVTMLDPACGTGGMLSVSEQYLRDLNERATLKAFGQELNGESYAICKADLMVTGQEPGNIRLGNSFTADAFAGRTYDYLLANPPFGVDWSKVHAEVTAEHAERGFAGRFGPGLPRKSDGQLLFLLHMMAKMKPASQGGSRLAIVFNGSPLFSGGAGSGESEIRRWIISHDYLEGIVALPDQLFYNTGISTYVWVVTNRKAPGRRGKVALVDGRSFFVKMRKSLGDKRNLLSEDQIAELTTLYGEAAEGEHVKVAPNEAFGYRRITVERPLKLAWRGGPEAVEALEAAKPFASLVQGRKADPEAGRALQERIVEALKGVPEEVAFDRGAFEAGLRGALADVWGELSASLRKAVWSACAIRHDDAPVVTDRRGDPEPDTELRDHENVPLGEDVEAYLEREVLPWVPDAWVDHDRTKVGYEIPFTRHFHVYEPPRPLAEIDADIKRLEAEILDLLSEVTK